jgi:hypothetical protein
MTLPNSAVGDLCVAVYPQHFVDQVGEVTVAWNCAAITAAGSPYQDVVNQLDSAWRGSGIRALGSSSITLRETRLYVLDPATGLTTQIAIANGGANAGTSSIGLAPSQVAPVIRKSTALAGRSGRGRMYHPFLLSSLLTATGELTAAAITSLTNAYAAFVTAQGVTSAGGTSSFVPVILHRNPLPLTSDPISSVAAVGYLGTQKRRGDYGRTNL